MEIILGMSLFVGALFGAGVCYVWLRANAKHRFSQVMLEVKAKAKAIEDETQLLVKSAEVKIKENELVQEREFQNRFAKLDVRHRALILQEKELASKEESLKLSEKKLLEKENKLEKLEILKQDEIGKAVESMQHIASFTKEEAKVYILAKVEEQSRADIADIVRRYEQEAKQEGEKKANYILAQATTKGRKKPTISWLKPQQDTQVSLQVSGLSTSLRSQVMSIKGVSSVKKGATSKPLRCFWVSISS